jgi:DNA (cytosine-5)-methyltransferase 1
MTPRPLRIGSLCTGTGAMELAVQAVLGGDLLWVADPDPDACKVIAHRLPGIPNLGDLTRVDWDRVPRVDLVSCGVPCSDISVAGRGAGIKEGTRSGVWIDITKALAHLLPRYVFIENVAVLRRRGLDQVLADLDALGYTCRWTTLRACDVGAPHRRDRRFLLGEHRDSSPVRADGTGGAPADPHGQPRQRHRSPEPAAPAGGRPRPDPGGRHRAPARCLAGTTSTSPLPAGGLRLPGGQVVPYSTDPAREHSTSLAPVVTALLRDSIQTTHAGTATPAPATTNWGPYTAAVRRWEQILGRPAPAPSTPGPRGTLRISVGILEFLAGLPDGYLAEVPGLTRRQGVRLAWNVCCVHQAAAALDHLLHRAADPG